MIDDKAVRLKQLLRTGKMKGYIFYDDIDELLPTGYEGGAELDDILSELAHNSIDVLEELTVKGAKELKKDAEISCENELKGLSERSGDLSPLQIYLREISSTPRLTNEEEFELARRISLGEGDTETLMRQLIEANLRLYVRA